jgi:CRISPR-associated protein Csb3
MNNPNPSICVNVDSTNPGQYFACCGLLELADRLYGGAEGWFADGKFCIAVNGTLEAVLQTLVACEPEEVATLDNGLAVKPLIAPVRLSFAGARPFTLTLDAWMTIRIEKHKVVVVANPPWNFWSGQQTSFRIWRDLRNALAKQLPTIAPEQLENLWFQRALVSGRFGFDPGAAWNALDVGFSPNEQGLSVASSPAVELFSAIGIQRFRPEVAEDRQTFNYATWACPLPPSVAAAAGSGVVDIPLIVRFRGRVVSRGSYAALGHSTPI